MTRPTPVSSSASAGHETHCEKELKPLRIGDVAKLTGMTLRALRYYEELGLIAPWNRTKGNFRLYSPTIIRRLEFINSLKKLDFSLEEIRELLGSTDEWQHDADIVRKTRDALVFKRDKITEKLIELEEMKHDVQRTLKILDECMICKAEQGDAPCDPDCEYKDQHIS